MRTAVIFILAFIINCTAQSPVKSLYEDPWDIEDAYYKDLNNDLDKFVGTWKYTNGTTSLTITLQKKLQAYSGYTRGINFYLDFLIGGYRYVENGVEKINTMPLLLQNYSSPYDYTVFGSVIIGPGSYYCLNCGPDDRKVLLSYIEPNRDIMGMEPEMIFQRVDSGGVHKLKLNFRTISGPVYINGVPLAYTTYSVPFGEYVLIKQ